MTRSKPAPDSSRIIANLFTTVPRSCWLLIIVAAMFMVAWSRAVPVFEAPDEPAHWQVARYVFDHQKLPLYDATMVEANQPPMYYMLIAPFARPSDEPTRAAWIDGDDTMRQTFPPRCI